MSDRTDLEARVRRSANETKKLRYKKVTTTSAGASDGSTVVSTSLSELNDTWNGCVCTILSGDSINAERQVEDFTSSTGILTFTNNVFPAQIASGVSIELVESSTWTGRTVEQAIKDAINFVAASVPKAVLRDYINVETAGGVAGVADPPSNALDIHHITIDGKPAVPVPVERASRLISGRDSFLPSSTTNRYLYVFEGKDNNNGQLRYAPANNVSVVYHIVPLFTAWDEDNNTRFPDELFAPVVCFATSILWDIDEQPDLGNVWRQRGIEYLQSRGIKITKKAKQEYI